MVKIERTNPGGVISNTWIEQLNYYNNSTLISIRNKLWYNAATEEIYVLGLINDNILFFIAFDEITGTISQTLQILDYSSGATTVEEIQIVGNTNIYILVDTSAQPTLHTYDPETASMQTSFSNIAALNLRSLTLVEDMLVVGGITTSSS
jgi:hypothetical protein